MLVFWKARLVLMAVPKTGTTALEAAFLPHADAAFLNPPALKHATVRRWRAQVSALFEAEGAPPMELVAVMREPVDWLSSWYRYRARPARIGRPQSTAGIGFAEFCEDWLADDPPEHARVGRQSRFLSDEDGLLGVDRLFRYDRLGEAVAYLEERLSVSVTLGRRNVSPEGPATELPDATLARLRRGAAADFALWDDLCAGRIGGQVGDAGAQ
ncbi:gamma-glutamyl kinase [Roseicyclus sp.]|uniref:gamma-glutamyl kinase n=1 Tax=Roseicyclus sp. TaxID=1914329 RepID=UPI003FA05AEF